MALFKRINKKAKAEDNTGFGTNANNYGGRFFNKNGNPNVQKIGIGFFDSISWYHTMLKIPRWKFFFIILLFYFIVNLFFATIYSLIGVEHLQGITSTTRLDKFGQAFFFSIQTFTTVGYGHISPSGFATSFVASVEALLGLLSFAIATGLFYGRFSKPKAFLLFSSQAIIAPYKEGRALMIRVVPHKNANLTDAEAKITLGISTEEKGVVANKFYNLNLEIEKISAFSLSWTLVHPITEDSPLYGFQQEDFQNLKGEFIVFIKAFDDMFSSTVVKRTSYTFDEVLYGAQFVSMFYKNAANSKTILDISRLNQTERIGL
jgi:inward rectifier potassium channel